MTWDRTEAMGLGVAIIAHILLLGLLSLSFNRTPRSFDNPPMSVEIIAEKAPVSTAPILSREAPAAQRGEEGEDAPDPAPVPKPEPKPAPPPPLPKALPRPPEPKPAARPTPPRPAPAARATPPRTTPPRPAPPRATPPPRPQPAARQTNSRQPAARTSPPRTPPARPNARTAGDPLGSIADSVSRTPNPNARAATPPAAQVAAQVRQDIRVSINQEVRAPWNACRVTGIDVDQLRTTVVFALQQNGQLARIVSVNTTGVNDSNRFQVSRFEECARNAIQRAAPFTLPAEHYSYWQTYTLDFEKR